MAAGCAGMRTSFLQAWQPARCAPLQILAALHVNIPLETYRSSAKKEDRSAEGMAPQSGLPLPFGRCAAASPPSQMLPFVPAGKKKYFSLFQGVSQGK